MNRIKINSLVTRPIDDSPVSAPFKLPSGLVPDNTPDFSNSGNVDSSESCLFLPLHYEKNFEYPLVVWLHDNGDQPQQIHRVMPQISLQNFVGVAPQAKLGASHCGYYWEQDAPSIDYSTDAVLAAIDLARYRANIASNRIFIAGSGSAGTMAFRVALTHPDLFAGVASINGPMPEGSAPLGRWSSSRNIEVFWSHSRKSEQFKQNELCQQLKLLHVAGFSVTLRQYPGKESSNATAFADLNRWIMEMFRSTVA